MVCLSADINVLIPQMELIQSLRLEHLNVSEVIYTNGWIHFACCSLPLVLFFLASLSLFTLFLPTQVPCSAPLFCPPSFPPHVERMTSSCSHLGGFCLCCEQCSFLTERGPDSAAVHSSCSGCASESCGRQACASGAAHMALCSSKNRLWLIRITPQLEKRHRESALCEEGKEWLWGPWGPNLHKYCYSALYPQALHVFSLLLLCISSRKSLSSV